MTEYVYYQPSKHKDGDCVVRAVCKATDMEWFDVYDELCRIGRKLQRMPNSDKTYKKMLVDRGFEYCGLKMEKGSKRLTVKEFARKHKKGTYVLRVAGHVVTVVNGKYYDIFDSGDYCVYSYFWKNE